MIDLLVEALLGPWKLLPPIVAIPIYVVIIAFWIRILIDLEHDAQNQSREGVAAYETENGYRFDPDDFE